LPILFAVYVPCVQAWKNDSGRSMDVPQNKVVTIEGQNGGREPSRSVQQLSFESPAMPVTVWHSGGNSGVSCWVAWAWNLDCQSVSRVRWCLKMASRFEAGLVSIRRGFFIQPHGQMRSSVPAKSASPSQKLPFAFGSIEPSEGEPAGTTCCHHAKRGRNNEPEGARPPRVSNMIGSPWPGHLLKPIRKSSGLMIVCTKEDCRWQQSSFQGGTASVRSQIRSHTPPARLR
jgi:hypothetical protein